MSSCYIPSFNLLLLLISQLVTALTTSSITKSSTKYEEFYIDESKNLTIPCESSGPVMWLKEYENTTQLIQIDPILTFINISEFDSGLYQCISAEIDNEFFNLNTSDTLNDTTLLIDNLYNNKEYKINIIVRTTPGPVTELYFKASTILGYLIWRVNKINTGGYPVRSFTAEFRNVSTDSNMTYEWARIDPTNIAPNIRQIEVYKLYPSTTYEFRIWANNKLGAGTIVTTNVTTLPETKEEDLIRLLQKDLENFDVRIWMVAVGIVLGTLIILAIGLTVLLSIEIYQSSTSFVDGCEEGWDSLEIVPNIIINPGFDEDGKITPYPKMTTMMMINDYDDSDTDSQSSMEKPIDVFKRKVSIFFTGQTTRPNVILK